MLLISSLHLHIADEYSETACAECVQHQCHGHLLQLSDGMHQCVLCQFLTLSYAATAIAALLCYQPKQKVSYALSRQIPRQASLRYTSLRAPPAV